MHRNGEKKSSINSVSPMVSVRFIYGSTTTHDGSATIHPKSLWSDDSHDASACTIQACGATTSSSSSYCIRDESGCIGVNRDESGCQ